MASSKRVSLSERRAKDRKGVAAFFEEPEQGAVSAAEQERPKLAKVTLYVRPDQVEAVEAIQLQERRRTGKRRDKSELYQEALDLLIAKYGLAD